MSRIAPAEPGRGQPDGGDFLADLPGSRPAAARLNRTRPIPLLRRARDLAALNVTAPLRFLSTRERLRFLRLYAGGGDRTLFRTISRRMKHLLRQKRCQGFLHDPAAPSYVGV